MDILDAIDAATGCQQCGGPLGESPSDDFCGQSCQERWAASHTQPLESYREAGNDFWGDEVRFNGPERQFTPMMDVVGHYQRLLEDQLTGHTVATPEPSGTVTLWNRPLNADEFRAWIETSQRYVASDLASPACVYSYDGTNWVEIGTADAVDIAFSGPSVPVGEDPEHE